MVAINYVGSIVCWLLIVIIIGIIVFIIALNRRKSQAKSIQLAIMASTVILFGVPGLIRGIDYLHRGNWRTFTIEDIQGTWIASYDKYGCWQFTGTEILTLNDNFTYEQLFTDAEGNRQYVAQNKWQLVDQAVILKAAKHPPYYSNECDKPPDNLLNSLTMLQEKDWKLQVWANLFATGGMMLEFHRGDPDAPTYIRYFKSE